MYHLSTLFSRARRRLKQRGQKKCDLHETCMTCNDVLHSRAERYNHVTWQCRMKKNARFPLHDAFLHFRTSIESPQPTFAPAAVLVMFSSACGRPLAAVPLGPRAVHRVIDVTWPATQNSSSAHLTSLAIVVRTSFRKQDGIEAQSVAHFPSGLWILGFRATYSKSFHVSLWIRAFRAKYSKSFQSSCLIQCLSKLI